MKKFLDKDFLLKTETAKTLYHEYAENCAEAVFAVVTLSPSLLESSVSALVLL